MEYKVDDKEVLHTFRLRSSEQSMVEQYRTLDPHGKDMVDTVLAKEADRIQELENKPTSTVIEFQPHLEVNAAHARTDIDVTEKYVVLLFHLLIPLNNQQKH